MAVQTRRPKRVAAASSRGGGTLPPRKHQVLSPRPAGIRKRRPPSSLLAKDRVTARAGAGSEQRASTTTTTARATTRPLATSRADAATAASHATTTSVQHPRPAGKRMSAQGPGNADIDTSHQQEARATRASSRLATERRRRASPPAPISTIPTRGRANPEAAAAPAPSYLSLPRVASSISSYFSPSRPSTPTPPPILPADPVTGRRKVYLTGNLEILVERTSTARFPRKLPRVRLLLQDPNYAISKERSDIHVPTIHRVPPIVPQRKRRVSEHMRDADYEAAHRKLEFTEKRLISREREIIRYEAYQEKLKEEKRIHLRINKLPQGGEEEEADHPVWPPTPVDERRGTLTTTNTPPVPTVVGIFQLERHPSLQVDLARVAELRQQIHQSEYSERSHRHAHRSRPGSASLPPAADAATASSSSSLLGSMSRPLRQVSHQVLRLLRGSTGLS